MQSSTIVFLKVLKRMRLDLVETIKNEDPKTFSEMFKYERSCAETEVSIKKRVLAWHISFWHYFDAEMKNANEKWNDEKFNDQAIEIFSKMIDSFDKSLGSLRGRELFEKIILENKKAIEDLQKFGENSEKNLSRFLYSYEKTKALFEREIKNLKE